MQFENIRIMIRTRLWAQILVGMVLGVTVGLLLSPTGAALIAPSIGIPASGIGLIIGVDRILDMCRTTVNVSGDLAACVIMDKWIAIPPDVSHKAINTNQV